MKIHEFQAKELFARYKIRVPKGIAARTAKAAEQAAVELGGGKVVVKSQIHAGGRGKGTLINAPEVNGVKVVDGAVALDRAPV